MKRLLFIFLMYLLTLPGLQAQQQYYDWYISAGSGAMAYYGDLSYKLKTTKINQPAYQLSIGKNISPSLAVSLQGSNGQISANDRARDWKGNLRTDNINFSRALNFQTDVLSAALLLSYRFDNGKVLSKHAFVAPYVYAGAGLTNFTVYGDLFTGSGQRYYYWQDNTIRSQPEEPGTQNTAEILSQDRKFETNLTSLATEQNYPTTVWSIPAGLGLKFRLSDRVSANLQAGATYAFSGYLDDVHRNYRAEYGNDMQAYAANPSRTLRDSRGNARNDMYLSAFLSVAYHFNLTKKNFSAPMVYTGYTPAQTLAYENDAERPDEPLPLPEKTQPVAIQPADKVNTSESKTQVSPPVADRGEDKGNSNANQTVDINLRVIVEGGKATVDTVTIPVSQAGSARHTIQPLTLDSLNSSTNSTKLSEQKAAYLPPYPTKTDTVYQENNKRLSSPDNELRNEFNRMRTELDSIKLVQQSLVTDNSENVSRKEISSERVSTLNSRPTTTNRESSRILALEQEVMRLRNDLANVKARKQTVTPATIQTTPRVEKKEPLSAGKNSSPDIRVAASLPLVTEKNYTQNDMAVLRKEIGTIQAQVEKMSRQQPTEKDTLVNTRIDSLMQLINKIEGLDKAPADSAVPAASIAQEENSLKMQLIDSLQRQVAGLNQSLSSIQASFSEELNNLSAGRPLSALGSTVIYYNINAAELTAKDKQRLSILAEQMKTNKSVILNIKGFTDQSGNAEYNLMLSRKRAENVKNYFVSQTGVSPDQILINFFGQQKASSGKGNPYDRKVEVELFRQ